MGDVEHGLPGEQGERFGLDPQERWPAASKVETCSDVNSRYGVSSLWSTGSSSWKANSGITANGTGDAAVASSGMDEGFRIEHDTMGEVRVPVGALWGAQTQRAVDNFPISGQPLRPGADRALASIKGVSAHGERASRVIADATSPRPSHARRPRWPGAARRPVPHRRLPDRLRHLDEHEHERGPGHARDASALGKPVHPNDHVNCSQSSNDVFPSAVHLAAVRDDRPRARSPPSSTWRTRCAGRQRSTRTVVKAGRTHLMDAAPVTLGQELGGYAAQVEAGVERLEACLPRLGELPLGGTAVGTGLTAPKRFAAGRHREARARLGLPLTEAP